MKNNTKREPRKRRSVYFSDSLWLELAEAAAIIGTDRSNLIRIACSEKLRRK